VQPNGTLDLVGVGRVPFALLMQRSTA